MTGTFYVLRNPEAQQRLVDELHTVWPVLDQAPSYEQLEKLPFLVNAFICQIYEFALRMEQTAVIKEALRISTAVPAGLPRIVPPSGAVISGVKIPGGVCTSCLSVIVSNLRPVSRPLLARAPFSYRSQKKYLLGRTSFFPIGGSSQNPNLWRTILLFSRKDRGVVWV